MPALFPPLNYGVVEEDIYRSGAPDSLNIEFLRSLRLKTIITLENNILDKSVVKFMEENEILLINASIIPSKEIALTQPISDEVVSTALKSIANNINLPILIVCKTGKFQTSVVVGCLRKLQRWSLMSIYEEFRRFAAGYKLQQQLEQFIELYDHEQIEISDTAPLFLRR